MADIGRYGALGIQGYYRGRKMREDAEDRAADREWTEGRRDRQVRREDYLDPAEEETVGIDLRRRRGQIEDEEFERPYRRKDVVRGDRRAGMEMEDYEFRRPLDRRALTRGDTMGEMDLEDREFERPYQRRAVQRGDEVGGLEVRGARRDDRVGEMEADSAERFFTAEERLEQARNALGILSMNGDPKAMEDWYNNLYDDDQDVEIERVGDDEYVFRHSSGHVQKTTKRELMESFQEHMLNNPNMAMLGGGGYGGMGGISRGRYGSRGTAGKLPSAFIQEIETRTNDYVRSGMDPLQARMQAYADQSYRSRTPPDEAVQAFYTDMVEQLLPEDMGYMSAGERSAAIQEAEEQAAIMAQSFETRFFGGGRGAGIGGQRGSAPGTGPAAGGGGQPRGGSFEQAAEMLRQNPDLAPQFDERYGPGAAERVLNGR